jgi:signal transduction histidine kinase/ActR/RegA family two-component response regulator
LQFSFFEERNLMSVAKKYITAGIKTHLKIEQVQQIKLTNTICLCVSFFYLFFFLYGLYFRQYAFCITAGSMLVINNISIVLNTRGFYDSSKLLLVTSNSFSLLAIKLTFNFDYSITAFYFPIIFSYAIFYDVHKQWKLYLPSLALTLVLIVCSFLIPSNRFNSVTLSPYMFQLASRVHYLMAFLLSIVMMFAVLNNYARTQVKLITAKERAETAEQVKSAFLNHISHELKTPLSGIMATTHLLLAQEANSQERQNEYYDTLKHSSEHLLRLVNDILDVSKIQTGSLALSRRVFSLQTLLTETTAIFQHRVIQKELSFNIKIDHRLNKQIRSDDVRLAHIISNLVDNALKFTEKGTIHFKAILIKETNAELVVKFSVADSGIGIKTHKLEQIFENFTQAETGSTRKFGGTGLGLSVSQQLINLLQGKLEVKSIYGHGSEFYFTLPFELDNSLPIQAIPVKEAEPFATSLKGCRILLAEDNPVNSLVVKKFLTQWEANFSVAADGMEAVEHFNKNDYDLVLLDLDMPRMDGFAALREIRKKNKSIPVLAFTAGLYDHTLKDLVSKGFSGYVVKPFNPDNLLKSIFKAIFQSKYQATDLLS